MLEEIALSISTAIFFLCTAVVSSILPSDTSEVSDVPTAVQCSSDIIMTETDTEIPASAVVFDLIGEWKSAGHTFEFKSPDRLTLDGLAMSYSLDGNVITVTSEIGGAVRTYELAFVPISDRVMKLNGITAYKIG
ncbi:MAG: hypothetical protein IJ428_05145 [Clostridia bacterium]|nr:hypothetical protein [Clostridia bacterium]